MTLEDDDICDNHNYKMHPVASALEKVLLAAQIQDSLTVGVYESAKLMDRDPDSVVLCLLAADPEDGQDVALNIHFTLIQAFCCDNDINIVRVSGLQRLSEILQPVTQPHSEPLDLHCILVSNPHNNPWKCSGLDEVFNYCAECRSRNQWIPFMSLMER
ncbi:growth arrest and DNA damage-inducible protein GADD45 beta [Hyperolius riggenbachi]|uniref:growth arrest and DNA damage-inducible protein GADD45 beta n=1 Tax=Hyperolius riggenbachi TaxID=752182 RepID=UPI0035A29AEF